jgi:hypothetical protein
MAVLLPPLERGAEVCQHAPLDEQLLLIGYASSGSSAHEQARFQKPTHRRSDTKTFRSSFWVGKAWEAEDVPM